MRTTIKWSVFFIAAMMLFPNISESRVKSTEKKKDATQSKSKVKKVQSEEIDARTISAERTKKHLSGKF